MATIERLFTINNLDGSAFSTANNPGASVRVENSNADGDDLGFFASATEVGNGVWSISFQDTSEGFYLLQTSTGAGWTTIRGFDPFSPKVASNLLLSGGTMTGDIDMNDKSITNAGKIDVKNDDDLIGDVQKQNVLDKTANETVSGDWTFSGDCTLNGDVEITKDKLTVDDIIVSPYIFITFTEIQSANLTRDKTNGTIFIADTNYEVVKVSEIHETAEVTASTMYVQLHRLSGTESKCAGDTMFTDNSNAGLSLKTTAKTIQTASLNSENKVLASGDRIGICLSADGNELSGLHITILLKRI